MKSNFSPVLSDKYLSMGYFFQNMLVTYLSYWWIPKFIPGPAQMQEFYWIKAKAPKLQISDVQYRDISRKRTPWIAPWKHLKLIKEALASQLSQLESQHSSSAVGSLWKWSHRFISVDESIVREVQESQLTGWSSTSAQRCSNRMETEKKRNEIISFQVINLPSKLRLLHSRSPVALKSLSSLHFV